MAQSSSTEYLSLEAAAARLHVSPDYLFHILDAHGLTPGLREALDRPISIRSSDLRAIRRIIRDETHRGAA